MSVRVIQGDCRTMLATLPDNSVQCVCTSPPYYGLRSYGIGTENGEIGQEQTPDAYVAEMVSVFREVRRVLRDDGTVWLNLGDSYATGTTAPRKATTIVGPEVPASWAGRSQPERLGTPFGYKTKDLLMMPARVALALQQDGWWLRSAIVWAKPNPMPESITDRPTSSYEMVFLLAKSERYFYDTEAIREGAVGANEHDLTGGRYAVPGQAPHTGSRKALRSATEARHRSSIPGGQSLQAQPDGTRNARNVWTIATQPYSGAHFATMPPDLAERCVRAGTSERGQCPHCGAPWARVVERTGVVDASAKGSRFDAGKTGSRDGADRTQAGERFLKVGAGWSPTCNCPEHKPVPQTVLDPFAGAGTTLLVADRLGRSGIGIELNPQYANLARARVVGDAPLFAEVAD